MAIELKDVVFSYPGQPAKPVLNIPHWQVSPGEKVFLHGPSGCGKSTLLNLLNGLFSPTQGKVTVLDERLDGMSARKKDRFRAAHIGCVFQQFNLISYLDAVDNVRLASKFSRKRRGSNIENDIKSLLSSLNIGERESKVPTCQLSIGQQQRIAIARALINKPRLLIADEPTSSLDHRNRDSFMDLLMDVVDESAVTLLFVSHDMNLARHFSRIDALTDIHRGEAI